MAKVSELERVTRLTTADEYVFEGGYTHHLRLLRILAATFLATRMGLFPRLLRNLLHAPTLMPQYYRLLHGSNHLDGLYTMPLVHSI